MIRFKLLSGPVALFGLLMLLLLLLPPLSLLEDSVPGVLEDGVPTASFGLGWKVVVIIIAISSPFSGAEALAHGRW